MRHQGSIGLPRPLHRAFLHYRNPVRHLRRGDYFPVSVGSQVSDSRLVWRSRGVRFPRNPGGWIPLVVQKRRAGLGVEQRPEQPFPAKAVVGFLCADQLFHGRGEDVDFARRRINVRCHAQTFEILV